MIAALLLLLLFGAGVLYFAPRKMKLAASGTEVMTRFMEQDYVCCDLSVARSTPRCEGVLRDVTALSQGGPNSQFTVAAGNAIAHCPSVELMGLAGDTAVLRLPIPFLAAKLQGKDAALRKKAAVLSVSDSTLAREIAQSVLHGAGPMCWGAGANSGPPSTETKAQCPHGPELVDAVAALFLDDQQPEEDRMKAAAMLSELGESARSTVPALARALENRKSSIRSAAARTLSGMGNAGPEVLLALTRVAYREPAPGLRQEMIANLARFDAKTACCYALFLAPNQECAETLAIVAHRQRSLAALSQAPEECPAALVLEIAENPAAIAQPMPYLAQGLRAPAIATRRRAASTVALIAGTLHWQSHIDRDVVDALQEAFRSGIPELTLDAAEALRQIPDSSLAGGFSAPPETFLAPLEDEKSERRAAAAWALGQVGRSALRAVPALRKALDQEDESIADTAYFALNRIAVAAGLERLGYKTNGKYVMRPQVLAALMKLSGGEPAAVSR
jgi:HEAT repeat protein